MNNHVLVGDDIREPSGVVKLARLDRYGECAEFIDSTCWAHDCSNVGSARNESASQVSTYEPGGPRDSNFQIGCARSRLARRGRIGSIHPREVLANFVGDTGGGRTMTYRRGIFGQTRAFRGIVEEAPRCRQNLWLSER